MTHSLDTPPTSDSTSTADTAKDEARAVGQTTADAGKQVAGTAAEQAAEVAQETKKQAADLLSEGRTQAVDQARAGQAKAAESLSALAEEMRGMTGGDGSGPAHDLVGQATGIVEDVAGRLRDREPGELLDDLRTFARRRPGAFLVGAAVAGVLAGRLTSGIKASHADDSGSAGATSPAAGLPDRPAGYAPSTTPVAGYETVTTTGLPSGSGQA